MGLRPVIPQKAAGCLIEPPVSVPVAAKADLAATAAAEPPDDPPGEIGLVLDHGFITFPFAAVSLLDPIANSSHDSLPNITAPSSHKFCVTVLS